VDSAAAVAVPDIPETVGPGPGPVPAPPPRPPSLLSPLLACPIAFIAIGLVQAVFLIGMVLAIDGRLPTNPAGLSKPFVDLVATPAGFLGCAAISASVFLGTALIGARLSRIAWRERLRLQPSSARPLHVAVAVLGLLGLGEAMDSAVNLLGWGNQGMLALMSKTVGSMSWPALLAAVVVVGLLAGTAEELFFRGFLQTRLRQRWGPLLAIVFTAVVFGLFHCDLLHTPLAAIIGVYLGWMTERVGSVRPAIAAHVINNVVSVGLMASGGLDVSTATAAVVGAIAFAVFVCATWAFARATVPPDPR
jgi:membrane protease YdiL (CAAX protease family)